MDKVSQILKDHYEQAFADHGPSSLGVDWGADEANLALRYDRMLAVLGDADVGAPTVLDVGCGFGGLLRHADRIGLDIAYTGVDVADNMIAWAREQFPGRRFIAGDVLDVALDAEYDYVVCNGILTQKLSTSGPEMDAYTDRLVKRMFALCRRGTAFNVMTTRVNYFAPNLHYRDPAEMLTWCLDELTPHVKLDHAYPLFEYTVYLYR